MVANYALTSLGASATHNRTDWQGTVANNAIDGNDGSYSLIQNPTGQWLRIDLGATKYITQYETEWVNSSWVAHAFRIESSVLGDDSDWVTRFTKASEPDAGTAGPTDITTPAEARYWRLYCTQANGEGMGPTKIALWGEDSAPVTDQTIYPSLFTDAQSFHAPTVSVGTADQTLQPSLLTNTSVFYAPTIEVVTDKTLSPPLLVNAQTFYAPTVEAGLTPGRRVYILGSNVPFWFEETQWDDDERKTYLMPFGLSNGGPGRRVVLPGLGTRLPIWIEEHPDHPETYFFPVQDADEPILMGLIQNADEILPGDPEP